MLAGALAGAILFLIYQIFLLIQTSVWSAVLPTIPAETRNSVALAATNVVFIQTQFLVAVLAVVLGTIALGKTRVWATALFGAFVSLALLTLTNQLISIALGQTSHLRALPTSDLVLMAQGLLLTWAILTSALGLGGLLPRIAAVMIKFSDRFLSAD